MLSEAQATRGHADRKRRRPRVGTSASAERVETAGKSPKTSDPGWMVRGEDGKTVGPVSTLLLQRGLNLGRVPQTAAVSRPDTNKWVPVQRALSAISRAAIPRPKRAVEAYQVVDVGSSPQMAERTPKPTAPLIAENVAEVVELNEAELKEEVIAHAAAPVRRRPSPPPKRAAAQTAEPTWAKAMTSIMPRISLAGAGALLDEPVAIPKTSALPLVAALTAFAATLAVIAVLLSGVLF